MTEFSFLGELKPCQKCQCEQMTKSIKSKAFSLGRKCIHAYTTWAFLYTAAFVKQVTNKSGVVILTHYL